MTIEAIGFIAPEASVEALAETRTGYLGRTDFASWLDAQMTQVSEQIQTGESLVRQLAVGETSNIHHVMVSLEKAKLSFELVMAVRNKALEAYQEVMRTQL